MKYWFISLFLIFSINTNSLFAQEQKEAKQAAARGTSVAFSQFFPDKHLVEWHRGMRFMMDGNPELIVPLYPYQMDGNPVHRLHPTIYKDKIFEVDTIEERMERCATGECIRSCIILVCEGKKYEHGMSGSKKELRLKEKHQDIYINGLMYVNDMERAKKLLEGKIIWVTNNEWQAVGMSYFMGALKYAPVRITKVTQGTYLAPVRIFFKAEGKSEAYFDVCMSNINVFDTKSPLSPHFSDCFTTENPYLNHKNVSLSDWDKIQRGEVTEGMHKEAAELSWGRPQQINKSERGGHPIEEWIYENNNVLLFEDELLIKYKK